ncbi:putative Sugar phosphate isomerase/epimerase [Candidatus Zixiibacteriota bacterium]|nr:putative Sugar phosphate isomerase/epimerase [candidate division Zixibacteria bacterium]
MANTEYKFGISTTFDYSVDIGTQVGLIAESGFDFISIGANLEHSHFEEPAKFERILKQVKAKGLFVDSAHAPFGEEYDPAQRDNSIREGAVSRLKSFQNLCAVYGIPIMILHPHHYFDGGREECLERAIKSLQELNEKKRPEVKIALENLPGGDSVWMFEKLMDRFSDSDFGFCYDSSHDNMSGDPFGLLENLAERLTTCHLSDNHGKDDEHLIPGDGIIDWRKMRGIFDRAMKIRNILFEVGTGAKLSEDPEIFLARTVRAARKIFSSA